MEATLKVYYDKRTAQKSNLKPACSRTGKPLPLIVFKSIFKLSQLSVFSFAKKTTIDINVVKILLSEKSTGGCLLAK